jgi:hypothetical protein
MGWVYFDVPLFWDCDWYQLDVFKAWSPGLKFE